jgi:hypothetical protein
MSAAAFPRNGKRRTLLPVHPEQQRYWIALLNLQRAWTTDEAAIGFIPPRHRDFSDPPGWSSRKALAYLHNNLELIRESWRRLEAGEPLDTDLLNHGLAQLRLRLHPWPNVTAVQAASQAKEEIGGRLETLQVGGTSNAFNPGTRYVRATVQRSLYYFAHYVDHRYADPAYPAASPERMRVIEATSGGDLVLVPGTAVKGGTPTA